LGPVLGPFAGRCLGPVLGPFCFGACRLSVLGLQNFPSGAPKPTARAELAACSD
jgi:hypothetical protein